MARISLTVRDRAKRTKIWDHQVNFRCTWQIFVPRLFRRKSGGLSNTPRPSVRPCVRPCVRACVRACVRHRYARSLKYCMYHHQISQEHCSGPTAAFLLIFCWNSNSKMAAGSHLGFSWCILTGMRAYCMYHHQISQEHSSGPTETSLLIFGWNSQFQDGRQPSWIFMM